MWTGDSGDRLFPCVASATGIDPESEMLTTARSAVRKARVELALIQDRAEELPQIIGTFDVAAIGRALHWLQREPMLRFLEWLVDKRGAVVVCGTTLFDAPENQWAERYGKIRGACPSDGDRYRYRADLGTWFAGSWFRPTDKVKVYEHRRVAASGLIGRVYSRSTPSLAVIGDRRGPFKAEVLNAMRPFTQNSLLGEEIVAHAVILRWRQQGQLSGRCHQNPFTGIVQIPGRECDGWKELSNLFSAVS